MTPEERINSLKGRIRFGKKIKAKDGVFMFACPFENDEYEYYEYDKNDEVIAAWRFDSFITQNQWVPLGVYAELLRIIEYDVYEDTGEIEYAWPENGKPDFNDEKWQKLWQQELEEMALKKNV